MELFSTLYLLPLLLLLPFTFFLTNSGDRKNLPLGSTGWPFFGENINLAIFGFPKFLKHRMTKHSKEVFQTTILGEKFAVFCGAKGNKFIMTNESKLVKRWLPQSLKRVLFPEFDSGLEEPVALFRNFRTDVFKPEALKQYIPVMDELASVHVAQLWKPDSVVGVVLSSKKYTFDLASRVFLNVIDPGRVERMMDPFARMIKGALSMPIDFPGTAFNGAIKGSRVVHSELLGIVRERRREVAERGGGEDLLSKLLRLRGEDGGCVSDEKVANFFMTLLMAAFESTASAIANVLCFLTELPEVYEEVLREQMVIARSKGPNELLTWDDTEKMKYSWNVVRESLRMASPTVGTFSEVTTEFTYAGFTIPKGWKTFWTVHSTHSNPEYFPEPEKFDPSRFEGSRPPPYTFLPFGGGPRICPGRDYAMLAILVFMYNVVTRFRFEKVIPNEKIVSHNSATLPQGLPLRLYPHPE